MVCHETYCDDSGTWLEPTEVGPNNSGKIIRQDTGAAVTVGRSEKMSKSRKNVIDPEDIIKRYGADTARWFMLSDSPPERDLEWTDSGIEGAWRFTGRIWRIIEESLPLLPAPDSPIPAEFNADALALRRLTHQAIGAATDGIERFQFNVAVARLYELANALGSYKVKDGGETAGARWTQREAIETLVIMISPMMPHLAEEAWQTLGREGLVADAPWPEADSTLLVENTVTIAVQLNGKMHATMEIVRDQPEEEIRTAVLALDKIEQAVTGKERSSNHCRTQSHRQCCRLTVVPNILPGRSWHVFCCLILLGNCGFQPLHGKRSQINAVDSINGMPYVVVGAMPDRAGHIVRNKLLDLLQLKGVADRPVFKLSVSLKESGEGMAFQQDDSATRFNLRLTAPV